MSSITLLTSAGAVRVAGENLVIDIRNLELGAEREVRAVVPFSDDAGTRIGISSAPAESASDKISRIVPETPANPSAPQARQATAAGDGSSSPVTGSPSAPSKAETGRAGGPVCAPVTHQENSLEREPETGTAIFPAAVSSSVGARQAADPKTSDWKQDRAPKPLRPHCLHPELCRSGTREHCHSCRKQMAESEVAA